MDKKIIGFAGRKQSGKSTCCNYILMTQMIKYGVCQKAALNEDGDIMISDLFNEIYSAGPPMFLFKEPYVDRNRLLNDWGVVKVLACADSLKRVLVDILGIDQYKIHGTDKDKLTETDYKWENMPGVVTNKYLFDSFYKKKVLGPDMPKRNQDENFKMVYHEPGNMTIRDLLQFVGTEIFRKMDYDVWINTLLRKIDSSNFKFNLISDLRFDNELNAVKEKGGLVIGLTRDIYESQDSHASEQINFDLCDEVIDNQDMNISELCESVYKLLQKHNINLVEIKKNEHTDSLL